jgi:hypothetical protein
MTPSSKTLTGKIQMGCFRHSIKYMQIKNNLEDPKSSNNVLWTKNNKIKSIERLTFCKLAYMRFKISLWSI